MVKYSVGVQQVGLQVSVSELGYTLVSVSRNRAPRSLGFWENPSLRHWGDCWRG